MREENTLPDNPDSVNSQTGRSSGRSFPWHLPRNRYLVVIGIFTLTGVIGGYLYYSLVGCKSGGCAITSNPVMSIIWGGMMGYLVPDFFIKEKKK